MDEQLRLRAENTMKLLGKIADVGDDPDRSDTQAVLAADFPHRACKNLIRDLLNAWEAEYHRPAPRPDTDVNMLRPCANVERPYPPGLVEDLVRAVEDYRTPDFVVRAIEGAGDVNAHERRAAWAASFAHVRVALSRLPEPQEIPF